MNTDEETFVNNLVAEMQGYRDTLKEIEFARDINCLSDAQFVARQALEKFHFYEGEEEEGQEEEGDLSKYPSFFKAFGRKPVAGIDYDSEGTMQQDDYEYFTGTGCYADNGIRESTDKGTYDDSFDPKETYLPDY